MKRAIILLSGGLDSTTCAAIAKDLGYEIYGLSFDYGQRHKLELEKSKQIAKHFAIKEHRIMKLDLRAFGGSALTDDIAVPEADNINDIGDQIPVTYVPARNVIFLSMALAYAETLECFDIFIGVNAVDYSGYPDCRAEFIQSFEKMANLATAFTQNTNKITIHTPLINLTKSEIIKLGTSLDVDYSLTTSCYNPDENGISCGKCDACLLRLKGFSDAGMNDAIHYHLKL